MNWGRNVFIRCGERGSLRPYKSDVYRAPVPLTIFAVWVFGDRALDLSEEKKQSWRVWNKVKIFWQFDLVTVAFHKVFFGWIKPDYCCRSWAFRDPYSTMILIEDAEQVLLSQFGSRRKRGFSITTFYEFREFFSFFETFKCALFQFCDGVIFLFFVYLKIGDCYPEELWFSLSNQMVFRTFGLCLILRSSLIISMWNIPNVYFRYYVSGLCCWCGFQTALYLIKIWKSLFLKLRTICFFFVVKEVFLFSSENFSAREAGEFSA